MDKKMFQKYYFAIYAETGHNKYILFVVWNECQSFLNKKIIIYGLDYTLGFKIYWTKLFANNVFSWLINYKYIFAG